MFLSIFSGSNRNPRNSQEGSRITENDVPVSHTLFSMQQELIEIFRHGYLLFHYEINPGGNLQATEFSLIHESCLEKYEAIKLQ